MTSKNVPAEVQATIQSAYRALMSKGGKRRASQQRMIGEIAKTVANAAQYEQERSPHRLLAVQAPTGTGKTYAYGIGAIPVAIAAGLKTIISTGTVNLQEQIMAKDLVELKSAIPELNAVLVKGRGRYACTIRVHEIARGDGLGEDDAMRAVGANLMRDLQSGAWSGDVDDLREQPDPKVWPAFTNDRNGCASRKCSQYQNCPYFAARKAMEAANVFITNHHLLLSDLNAGNFILPKVEHSVVIVDEAHDLPNIALSNLEGRSALEDSQRWVMRAMRVVASIRAMGKSTPLGNQCGDTADRLQSMAASIAEAQLAITSTGKTSEVRDPNRALRFPNGELPQWLAEVANDCKRAAEESQKGIAALIELLSGDECDYLPMPSIEKMLSDLGRVQGRLDGIVAVWHLMSLSNMDGQPVAKWIEIDDAADDLRVCASPVGVGAFLHEVLWSKCAASIHLSATLTTVGGFEPYLIESGLGRTAGCGTLEVDSPFDYQRQASLCVPKGLANPKDPEAHTRDVIKLTVKLLNSQRDGEGSLFLFASWKQLKEVLAAMPEEIRGFILAQGEGISKREMIERHKKIIGAGGKSSLFATQSFEQGVDLQGNLCTTVAVAKLQFAVPTHPVLEARKEYIESQGGSYFDEVVIPETSRRLAQSTGRLIRSETDEGRIIVMDPRLTSTRYGRAMLGSLPGYRMETDFAEMHPVASTNPAQPQIGLQPAPW